MSNRQSSAKRRALSASSVLDAIASDLATIKAEDGLTYVDIGRILGKCDDMAARYCDGTAEMGITAYAFARKEWNGRFTGKLDALIEECRGDRHTDREKEAHILQAAYALSTALFDGDITDAEICASRSVLEAARDDIETLLRRIGPKEARA